MTPEIAAALDVYEDNLTARDGTHPEDLAVTERLRASLVEAIEGLEAERDQASTSADEYCAALDKTIRDLDAAREHLDRETKSNTNARQQLGVALEALKRAEGEQDALREALREMVERFDPVGASEWYGPGLSEAEAATARRARALLAEGAKGGR